MHVSSGSSGFLKQRIEQAVVFGLRALPSAAAGPAPASGAPGGARRRRRPAPPIPAATANRSQTAIYHRVPACCQRLSRMLRRKCCQLRVRRPCAAASGYPDGGARCRRRCTARRPGCGRTARRPTSRPAPHRRVAGWPPVAGGAGCRRPGSAARRRCRAPAARSARSSSMWPLLPPGAAQASSTRMPSCRSSSGAASCAAASCTDTRPVSKPGICVTGSGRRRRTASAPICAASIAWLSQQAQVVGDAAVRRLTRRVSGGGAVADCQDALPVVRPRRAHRIDPPLRIVPARARVASAPAAAGLRARAGNAAAPR